MWFLTEVTPLCNNNCINIQGYSKWLSIHNTVVCLSCFLFFGLLLDLIGESVICDFWQKPRRCVITILLIYRVIQNDCRGFNNLSYKIHLKLQYMYFLFNRTTLPVFVTYHTAALYVHRLWLYKHQHDNPVRSKLSVACQRWRFQWRFWFVPSVPG